MGATGLLLAACQPKIVEVTKVVKEVVKETVEVEKEKVVQQTVVVEKQKEVTKIVEKAITKAPVSGEMRIASINDASVNAVMDILLAGFGTRYPDVKTKIEYQVGDYSERMYTQAAAGNLPDVVWTANLFTLGFVTNGVLKDLMPFIEKDKEFNLDDIYPVILSEARIEGNTGLFYLPASLDVVTMYYNKTALKAVGADTPTANWTWDDFVTAGLKVIAEKDKDGNPKMWMLDKATWNWSATVHPWLVGYGGDVLDKAGKKSTWSSPESLAGLEAYTALWLKHKIAQPIAVDVGGTAFQLGRAVCYTHIAGLRKNFRDTIGDKFEWDCEMVPKMPDGKHRTGMGSYGFGVFTKAKLPDVAWDFIKYLDMATTQLIMAKNMAGIPLLKSLATDQRWLEQLTPPPTNNKCFVDAALDGVFSRTFPLDCGGFYTGVTSQTYVAALESVLREQKTVKEAFTECDAKIQACLNKAYGA